MLRTTKSVKEERRPSPTSALGPETPAFAGALLDRAKMNILVASLLAGGVGFGLLVLATSTHEEGSQLQADPAPVE